MHSIASSRPPRGVAILVLVAVLLAVSAAGCSWPPREEGSEPPPSRHPGWTTFTNANLIGDIAVDPEGYLWAVGMGGAVRWHPSGGSYVHYTVDHGLAANSVQSVAVAPAQPGCDCIATLWFGTRDAGVTRYHLPGLGNRDAAPDRAWTTFTTEDGLADNSVTSIAVAATPQGEEGGAVWFGTRAGASRYVDPVVGGEDSAGWTTFSERDGLADNAIRDMSVGPDGAIWFATDGGVSRYASPVGVPEEGAGWTTFTEADGLASDAVLAVAVEEAPPGSASSRLWFGTRDAGISRLEGETWTRFTQEDGLASDRIQSLAVDSSGQAWAGTAHGVSRLDGEQWTSYGKDSVLGHQDVRAVAVSQAPEGVKFSTVWLGTWGGGISRWSGERWSTYGTEGPGGNYVHAIAVAPSGEIWISTRDGGVSMYDGQTWTTYTTDDGLARDDVRAIAVTPEGVLWFGTRNGGASRFDGETWTTFDVGDGLAGSSVSAIAVAPDQPGGEGGAVWLGTFGNGVSRYDGETWITYTEDDGLAQNEVQSVAVSGDGVVWVGTDEQGLSRSIQPPAGTGDSATWMTYTNRDGLARNNVRTIETVPSEPGEENSGGLWIGTYNSGVSYFDGDRWTSYGVNDGLGDPDIYDIAVAPDSSVWFATFDGGVYRFDGNTWTHLSTSDGLPHNSVRAVTVAPDGAIWFGFDGAGVARYIPGD